MGAFTAPWPNDTMLTESKSNLILTYKNNQRFSKNDLVKNNSYKKYL